MSRHCLLQDNRLYDKLPRVLLLHLPFVSLSQIPTMDEPDYWPAIHAI